MTFQTFIEKSTILFLHNYNHTLIGSTLQCNTAQSPCKILTDNEIKEEYEVRQVAPVLNNSPTGNPRGIRVRKRRSKYARCKAKFYKATLENISGLRGMSQETTEADKNKKLGHTNILEGFHVIHLKSNL